MILDAATALLLAAKILLIACSAFVASVFLYAYAANAWYARELRRWAKRLHKGRQRRAEEAKALQEIASDVNGALGALVAPKADFEIHPNRRHESRAIPTDRDHPLHTLGGRFQ
jgi:hypothetical protein